MNCDKTNNSKTTLKDLIQILKDSFNSGNADNDFIRNVLTKYKSKEDDWVKYAKFNDACYTRNLIDKEEGKFDLMLLAWGPGHRSSVHDHAEAKCFMKILAGTITEIRYKWPKSGHGLTAIAEQTLHKNEVAFIEDSLGVHEMMNETDAPAVSLHLYSPHFDTCHTFSKDTGTSTVCHMTFFSEYGEIKSDGTDKDSTSESESLKPCC